MYIESIQQESMSETGEVFTRVTLGGVTNQCILTRLLIKALGRPGTDNDMAFAIADNQCIIVWTHPQLTLSEVSEVISKAIEPITDL